MQVTHAFSYSTDDTQYPFSPSGHSYDYSFSTYEMVALNGHVDVTDPTYAEANIVTTITLDTPTAWHLTEDAGAGTDSVTADLGFRGAALFAGPPPQPGDNNAVSLLPNFYGVYFNGGEASGVLSPGTYTYIAYTGGVTVNTQDLTTDSDFALTELPEPMIGLPMFAASLLLIRRR